VVSGDGINLRLQRWNALRALEDAPMNAPVIVRPVHAEHTKLMRDRDPWDIPVRLLPAEDLDPLQDIQSEDFALAYMLSFPGRIKSLSATDFTGRDRPVVFTALDALALKSEEERRSLLDKLDERLDCPGYVSELRWQPTLAKGSMVEVVANLKRLSGLRRLAERMDALRRRMPTMTEQTARSELAKLCFGRGNK
jgi:hypothetical protein